MDKNKLVYWLVALNKGEDIREELRAQILMEDARNGPFSYISHPEYLGVGDIKENNGLLEGKVFYRGDAANAVQAKVSLCEED
jgi:hypothetical protein